MFRLVAPLALVTTSLAALAACGGSSSSTPPAADASPSDTRDALVIAYLSDIGNLNPAVLETAADRDVTTALFYPLMDSDFDCEIIAEPGIYKSWSFSEDGKELTVQLRDDIAWADGEVVDAADVLLYFDVIGDPAAASPQINYLEKFVEGYPKATSPTELVFKYTDVFDRTTMLSQASIGYLPAHLLADADRSTLRGNPISAKPVPSGPWRLKLHEPGSRFVLEPNPDFTGPADKKPKLNRVVFSIIPEYSTRLIKLVNGEVDVMEGLNIEDVDRLKKDHADDITVYSRGYRFSDYLAWNAQRPPFDDPEVRKALTLAIDIQDMIGKMITGEDGTVYAKPMVSTVTPELCNVHANDIEPLPYNLEEAKRILATKGWTDSDNDGILDKDGKPFRFTLGTNAGNKRRADSSILIQAQLKKLGVQVDLEQRESNTFFEALRNRDYDAALAGWSAALFVDPTTLWACETDEKKYPFNFTSYCNPEVDKLMAEALRTPDPAVSAPLWKEVQRKIYDDQPYTFLWWREELVGVSSRFENVGMDVGGLLTDLEQWSVPADKVKYAR